MLGADLPGLHGCRKCPRLVRYIETLAPKRAYRREDYWNAPVPGFGDPRARVCLVGLAPGAHGANRTGRPFTGDGAGDFMYPLLHRAGYASQAEANDAADGLQLRDLYISNAVKCVPPGNKPELAEFENCRPFLEAELNHLCRLRVVILLGQGAFTSYLRMLRAQGVIGRLADYPFAHGASYRPARGPQLVASYHTSRYNVQTGRMTEGMFLDLLSQVRRLAAAESG
ncbi:MAG: uracil-DNA glycosylase [Desulfuromonas sp.]|uniref:uracil-DNA glycosylase n=1 Tax=Desulfuromonas sp. TaxID=892 RepID=UPI000CC1E581|nr:uracil-DNA glycosylase [Desulfuromonas sp.]PLX83602.1 MAG: uracil-DNA glycosylase [Desulfuromonas sp.]